VFSWLMVALPMLFLVALVGYPFFYGIWISLQNRPVAQPGVFIGLDNFAELARDRQTPIILGNTVVLVIATTLIPTVLGLAYLSLHFVGTAAALVWLHRRHPEHFPIVRTTLVTATALALVGYVLYPAAPPRLAGLGFSDTVTTHAGINLSSDLLGTLYNPFAAVPSLHFGYALIVGVALATLASHRIVRVAGALYPLAMLLVIVGTGNHFVFDAALGAVVVVAGWLVARFLVEAPAPARRRERRVDERPEPCCS